MSSLVRDHLEFGGHARLRLFQIGVLVVQFLLQTAVAFGLRCELGVQVHGLAHAVLHQLLLLTDPAFQIRAFLCIALSDQPDRCRILGPRPPSKADGTQQQAEAKTEKE